MYKPLVSIIIPVYNGSNYLNQAINSALSQTYNNIEIIVINDGSNDNGTTEEIALSYGEKIRYMCKENGGISSALNYGVHHMKGEWVSWLSHDDLYLEDKIEKQIIEMNKYIKSSKNYSHEKIILLSRHILIDKNGNTINRPRILRENRIGEFDGKRMFIMTINDRMTINGCSLLLPKKCFQEIGYFDESLKYLQDYDFWYRLMLNGYSFVSMENISVMTRIHSQQTQAKYPNLYYVEREKLGKKVVDFYLDNINGKQEILVEYLYSCSRNGNYSVEKYIIEILKAKGSLNIGNLIICKIGRIKATIVNMLKAIYKRFYKNKYRN